MVTSPARANANTERNETDERFTGERQSGIGGRFIIPPAADSDRGAAESARSVGAAAVSAGEAVDVGAAGPEVLVAPGVFAAGLAAFDVALAAAVAAPDTVLVDVVADLVAADLNSIFPSTG